MKEVVSSQIYISGPAGNCSAFQVSHAEKIAKSRAVMRGETGLIISF
jgi:hypothetical protein